MAKAKLKHKVIESEVALNLTLEEAFAIYCILAGATGTITYDVYLKLHEILGTERIPLHVVNLNSVEQEIERLAQRFRSKLHSKKLEDLKLEDLK